MPFHLHSNNQSTSLFKSPRYTGGDFMFLYRFVRCRRRRWPQILVHAITFEQLFGFLYFWHDCWPWPTDKLIRFWAIFVVTLTLTLTWDHRVWLWPWLWPWIFKVKYQIGYMVRLPRNEKQTHRLNSRLQMRPSGLTLTMTLTLNFQGQISNWIYLKKMVRLPRNEKQTYRLISRPQMWPSGLTLAMTLTLNFQCQIWNWLYLYQKWSDCHETKSEHIDWTLGLKCNHQIWPWPWPWPWLFKVKYEICYISTKSGPIATRRKANISI